MLLNIANVICCCLITLTLSYHMNSTHEETISTRLWQNYGKEIGELNGEKLTSSILNKFKCFDCINCANLERMKIMGKMENVVLSRDNLVSITNQVLFNVLLYDEECNISVNTAKWLPCDNSLCIEGFLATELFGYDQLLYHDEDQVKKGLKRIMQIGYKPTNVNQCFTRLDLFKDFTATNKLTRSDVKFISTALALRLSKGDCISLQSQLDFLSEIFDKYSLSNAIKIEGLERLMTDLGIEIDQHDHDHDHDNDNDHDHDHDHDHKHDHDHDHDHDHNHDHYKTTGEIQLMHFTEENQKFKRSIDEKQIKNSTNQCWSPDDLLHKFDADNSHGLNRDEFLHLCPALIQQKIKGKCDDEKTKNKLNAAEVYGYATLTVFIISLCSLLGVVLMPIQHSHLYRYIMVCLIALAFGTLTGDALMHLIPEAVGLHVHDSHDHHHSHDGLELPSYFWKFLSMLGAIYLLFVVELVSHMAISEIDEKDENHRHNHSHIPNVNLVRLAAKRDEDKGISNETLNTIAGSAATLNIEQPERNHRIEAPQISNPKVQCWGFTTLALVIIIGDGIHNVADGLTIGAAFSSSIKGGLSSALAIFFHELPHEFGDFVILLSTGLSYKKALLWNFISSLTAFIGLYVGIELGENTVARQWILAIAAGMFLYIALGNMLPELKNQKGKNNAWNFLAQNVGVLIGMSFMILIGIFEEKIQI